MMRRAALALAAALWAGCTISSEQHGSRALLADEPPSTGIVHAESAVAALGVPDEISLAGDGFRFSYHSSGRKERRFGIVSYGLKLVTAERIERRERSLDLWFDSSGRLLASQLRDLTQDPESESGYSDGFAK